MPPQIDVKAYETNFRVPNQVAQASKLGGNQINPGLMFGLQTAAQGATSGIPYMLANFISQYPYFEQQFPQTAKDMSGYLPNNPSQYAPYSAGIANGIDAYGLYKGGYNTLAGSSALQGMSQVLRAPQIGMNQTADYAQTGADVLGLAGAVQQLKENPAFAISRGITSGKNLATSLGVKVGEQTGGMLSGVAGAAGIYSGVEQLKDNPVLGAAQIVRGGSDLYGAAQSLGLINSGAATNVGVQAAKSGVQAASTGAQAGAAAGSFDGIGSTLGTIGSYLGPAIAAYGIGETAFGDGTAEDKARDTKMQAEDAVAAYYTMGLSTAAQFADRKLLGGQTDKLRQKANDIQNSPIGAVINPAGFLTNKILEGGFRAVGSKKGDRQITRDQYRKAAKEQGILDENYGLKLDDGTVFDAGADGSEMDAKKISKQEGFGDAASAADAISSGMGFQGKQREAMSLLFAKAALSSGDSKRNLQSIAKQHGMSGDSIQESLDKQHEAGDISDNEYIVWSSKAKDVFGGKGGNRPLKDNTTKEAQARNRDKGAEVIGIPKESVPKPPMDVKEYVKKKGLKPGQSFRIPGNPNVMSLQPDGTIISTLMGFDDSKVDYDGDPEIIDTSKKPKYDSNLLRLGVR